MSRRWGRPILVVATMVGMLWAGVLADTAPKADGAKKEAPKAEAPASSVVPAGGTGKTPAQGDSPGLEVITRDPNHMSAVEALERIRRDEDDSAEGRTFNYEAGDRRDPFLSPLDILKAQMSNQICEGEGMECWLIQDVSVIGVLARRDGNVALVIGPDGYGSTLRVGDALYDGEVRRIDPETGLVVFRQRLNDPARIKPFRDIEKGLNLNKEGRS